MNYSAIFGFTLVTFLSLSVITDGKTYIEDLTLTASEKKSLDKFKEIVADRLPHEYMKHDAYLIRWLRAKYFNIRDAEKMLMDNVKWRKENNMDTIHQEDFSDIEKDYKYHLESRDKEGKPLLYVNGGNWDLRNIAVTGKRERFNRYIDKTLDDACGLVRELGEKYKNVSQGMMILNIDGFNLVQHGCIQCIPVFLRILTQYEAHFPGCVDKIIVVNLPQAAEPILAAARAVFHPDTNKSLFIFAKNKSKWYPVLRQYFDNDQLPVELGGTKVYKGTEDYDYNF
jgi:hypothetical protein